MAACLFQPFRLVYLQLHYRIVGPPSKFTPRSPVPYTDPIYQTTPLAAFNVYISPSGVFRGAGVPSNEFYQKSCPLSSILQHCPETEVDFQCWSAPVIDAEQYCIIRGEEAAPDPVLTLVTTNPYLSVLVLSATLRFPDREKGALHDWIAALALSPYAALKFKFLVFICSFIPSTLYALRDAEFRDRWILIQRY